MIIEWRELPGFPSYEVCTDGKVRRKMVPRREWTPQFGTWPGRHLKQSDEYHPTVYVYGNGKTHKRKVAELVLITFVGEPPSPDSSPVHIDGNTQNNKLYNLRWSNPETDGVIGSLRGKLTQTDVDEIRAAREQPNPPTLAKLAARYGVSLKQIWRIVNNLSRK